MSESATSTIAGNFPTRVQHLLNKFFEIGMKIEPESGKDFVGLFTKDGVLKTHETVVLRGHDELATVHAKLHPALESRWHTVSGTFVSTSSPDTDFAVLGRFNDVLKDGNVVGMDFTARFIVKEEDGVEKLGSVRVWTDPAEMLAAFKNAEQSLNLKHE
ncbi:hypothetical protein BU24DRAFT_491323 [Aaosphaeria arxii CBS 175.79]|uniref:SnoaL-like domain-containing protein n=1 Tax=Aaosphaeria arxii CBS 175.79 TaxID=1450172 RepID=A0A6A5XZK9_9PLEO|nr:uncharacterized protein BU24DRAFT_491323 [Aaosphaeria arxii CBS 175.79]KAF2018343.1 hypothetical protein BU24DRAFT_491323 [Aaosphaeria arxii CBS 175.79]